MNLTYWAQWAHPERNRLRRTGEGPPHVLVIHTSEQFVPTVTNGSQLAAFIAGPAERDAAGQITNQASYHWCVDLAKVHHMVRVVDRDGRDDIAFHAPPNWRGESICLTGRAARDWTGTSDGVDDWAQLLLAAELVAERLTARGWPAVKLTVADVQAGRTGMCGHHDISLAFGQTNHTDPGAGFPWPQFVAMVQAHMTPDPLPETEDDDVTYIAIKAPNRGWALVAHDGAGIEMIGLVDADRDTLVAAYRATKVSVSDAQWDDYVAHHKASKPAPVGG